VRLVALTRVLICAAMSATLPQFTGDLHGAPMRTCPAKLAWIFVALFAAGCASSGGGGLGAHDATGADASADSTDTGAATSPTAVAIVDAAYMPTALALVEGAQESIRLVHFEMHDDSVIDQMAQALVEACGRGIDVQVMLEDELDFNAPRVAQLEAAGCRARLDSPDRYTHAKLIVVDSQRVLLGSSNLSHVSVQQNHECNLRLDGAAAGDYFHAYADALWADDTKSPVLDAPVFDDFTAYTDGGFLGVAVPRIEGAQQRIWVITYGMNSRSVYNTMTLLGQAAARGVDVRVLLERADWNPGLTGLNEDAAELLGTMGVRARLDPASVITHAKLVLADGTAIVGSNNWGQGGFSSYHEVGALTTSPKAVDALAEYFEALWEEAGAAE
jgi:phosphatidylserine/phosphatidylglycerophosphate/cardiolipin synthase-like enzyme